MQREVDGQKQQLSSDQVALYRYRAEQIRQTSDALRQGRVVLRPGRWNAAAHTVLTCEGQTVTPDLDSRALAHIERRQSHASAAVSIAGWRRRKALNCCWSPMKTSAPGSRRKKSF